MILALLLSPTAGQAAEFHARTLGDDTALVIVDGEIGIEDAQRFDAFMQRYSKGAVLFKSSGGSLLDGVGIGDMIRVKSLSTGVAPNTLCASACAFAWLGGTQRYMATTARVGFHSADAAGGDSLGRDTSSGSAMLAAYLARLVLPARAITHIADAKLGGTNWLTMDDANRLGIDVSLLDDEGSSSGLKRTPSAIQPQSDTYYVSGLDPNGDNWLALKAGPNVKSKRLLKMGPGTRLHVLGREGSWLQVQLDDGTRGWFFSKYVACCTYAEGQLSRP